MEPTLTTKKCWIMHFDGSLTKEGASGGLVFMSPSGEQLRHIVCLCFQASNNGAEYEAVVNDLRIVVHLGIRCLDVGGDSQLVIGQVMKESECHNPKMVAYCQEVRQLEDQFNSLRLNHIPQRDNEAADTFAKMASGRTTV
jgi:ribonuclease HI